MPNGDQEFPNLAELTDGNVVITWTDSINGGQKGIYTKGDPRRKGSRFRKRIGLHWALIKLILH